MSYQVQKAGKGWKMIVSMMLNFTESKASIITLECDLKDGTEDVLSKLKLKCQVNICRMCTINKSTLKSEAEGEKRVCEFNFNSL